VPFKFKPYFKAAFCEQDLVLLNLQADAYQILEGIDVGELNSVLSADSDHHNSPIIQALQTVGAIQESSSTYDQVQAKRLGNFFEQRWMAPAVSADGMESKYRLACLREVMRTGWTMKWLTIGKIVTSLNHSKSSYHAKESDISDDESLARLNALMAALNTAFLWDVSRNKCLGILLRAG